jgi:hypothetical protein
MLTAHLTFDQCNEQYRLEDREGNLVGLVRMCGEGWLVFSQVLGEAIPIGYAYNLHEGLDYLAEHSESNECPVCDGYGCPKIDDGDEENGVGPGYDFGSNCKACKGSGEIAFPSSIPMRRPLDGN